MSPELLTACRLIVEAINGENLSNDTKVTTEALFREFLDITQKELQITKRHVAAALARETGIIT